MYIYIYDFKEEIMQTFCCVSTNGYEIMIEQSWKNQRACTWLIFAGLVMDIVSDVQYLYVNAL